MQASLISNVTHHRWGAADDIKTLHERKTDKQLAVNLFRPMFCLTYARRPDALQGRQLEPHADKCVHLGTSPNKPGYWLEVLEGPRKGKLITTTQVVSARRCSRCALSTSHLRTTRTDPAHI
eukprot:5153488-Pleurochrysis_carterae.AAC.1